MRFDSSCPVLDFPQFLRPSFLTPFLLLFFVLSISACDNRDQGSYTPSFSTKSPRVLVEYIFGVHPLHNPKRLHEIFSPITDYLTEKISDAIFRVEASRNYAAYDEKLYAGRFHFALLL